MFLSEAWFPFSYVGFYLEEFVVYVVTQILLSFSREEDVNFARQVCIEDPMSGANDLADELTLSFTLIPMWFRIQQWMTESITIDFL